MIIFSKCSRCTIIFNTPLICCCSPLSVPVVRGEVAMATVISSLSFLSSSHFSLATFSITSLQLLPSFAIVLPSPPTRSRSLLAQSSHYIPGLPHLHFNPLSGPSALFSNFSTPILSTCLPISTYSSPLSS